ncbi:MAG: hypothetical protein FWD26_07885 [Treponema sp.]|nr:hypothetical protein [Treponema sp.]
MKTNIYSKQIALTMILAISCISLPKLWAHVFNFNRMNLSNNVSSNILPLQSMAGDLYQNQVRSIMGSFFTSGAENFGYYTIKLSSNYIGRGPRDTAIEAAFITAGGLTLCLTMPFLPCGERRYQLTASIEFFDHNRQKITEFSDSAVYDGLEYIHKNSHRKNDHTFKTENQFRNLLRNCLNAASRNADNINKLLVDAKYPPIPISTAARNAFNELRTKIPECSETAGCSRIAVIGANDNTDVAAAVMQIENHFLNADGYHAVDRITLNFIMAELELSNSPFVSTADAIRIGKLASARYLIIVDINGTGVNRSLVFRAVVVETGTVIASFSSPFSI